MVHVRNQVLDDELRCGVAWLADRQGDVVELCGRLQALLEECKLFERVLL